MHNRQSVRLISGDVWEKIKQIFPKTLDHSFEPKKINATGNCVQCHLDAEDERLFPQKLKEWKSMALQPPLSELLHRGKQATNVYPSQLDLLLQNELTEPLHLRALNRADLQRWRDSFCVAEKASKKSNGAVKRQLNNLFASCEWKIQSLICEEHNMTVGIPSKSEQDDITSWLEKLKTSNVELLLIEEYDELLRSLKLLESLLCSSGNGSDPLSRKMNPQPTVIIDPHKGTRIIAIDPPACTHGCSLCSSGNECIESGGMISNPEPNSAHKTQIVNEVGPLCKVFVHEVENGASIDVAASIIVVDASNRDTPIPSLSATGRPRRSRKCRGKEVGVYSVDDVEMALDGNLAHLRLLLHQTKRKKILGQKLFLLHTLSEHADAPQFTELTHEYNEKSLLELVSLSDSNNSKVGSPGKQENCKIHLVMSYDDHESSQPNKRTRLNKVNKDEEDDLILSLSNISNGGWRSDDGYVVMGGKQSKRRRQERGFQGTFLQTTEFDERDNLANVEIENSPTVLQQVDSDDVLFIDTVQDDQHVARAHDDVKKTQLNVEQEINSAIRPESNRDSVEPACEADSRCKAPTFLQSTGLVEKDNLANVEIEDSPTLLQRVDSDDVLFIDSVQDGQHVARAHDDVKNAHLDAEEVLNSAVISSESNRDSVESVYLVHTHIENSPTVLQRVDSEDILFIDRYHDDQHVARAHDDIKDTQMNVEQEMNSTVTSSESHRDSIELRCEAKRRPKTPKRPFCEVFVHEVERGSSTDVAASIILVDASKHVTPSSPATKRASRSQKSCFATYQVKQNMSKTEQSRIHKQKSRQRQKRTAEAHLNETKILFLVTGTANCHLTFVNKNDEHVALYENIGKNIVPKNDTTSEIVKMTDEGGTIKFSADEIIAVSVAYFKILHPEYLLSTDWQNAYSKYICLWEKWCVHFAFCINTVQISSLRDTFVSFCEVIS